MDIWLLFVLSGCLVGFLSGLLGIGGGTIIVPITLYALKSINVDDALIMKIAISTSFSIIIVSMASSAWAHNKKGGILWVQLRPMILFAIIGVIFGAYIVTSLNNQFLQVFFCFFLAYTIIKMLRKKTSATNAIEQPHVGKPVLAASGFTIGFLASFIGIGGGAITVPLLAKFGFNIRKAIASSSVLGAVLAITGALSGIFYGWNSPNLPAHSLGFVYLPAFIGIATTSFLFAPLGAKMAYKLPVKRINQIFALFLLVILIDMLIDLL